MVSVNLSTFMFTILSYLNLFFQKCEKLYFYRVSIFGILSVFILSRVNSLMVRMVAEAFHRGGPVSIPTILYGICGKRSGSGTVFFLVTTAFPCKYHSFITPYPFTWLSPALHNLWQWVHVSIVHVNIPARWTRTFLRLFIINSCSLF